jgi:hypothetical protein
MLKFLASTAGITFCHRLALIFSPRRIHLFESRGVSKLLSPVVDWDSRAPCHRTCGELRSPTCVIVGMPTPNNSLRTAVAVIAVVVSSLLGACDFDASRQAGTPDKPRGFESSSGIVRDQGHLARCNTVHSLTLPREIQQRYRVKAHDDTAVISCSLQVESVGSPTNVAARVSGTQTLLTGRTTPLDFKEILDEDAVSYVATFSIAAKLAIDFNVTLTDLQSGATYRVKLRQSDLPGRL